MGWVVNATPRPLYPRERPGTHCIGGWWATGSFWTGAENLVATGIRSLDRPARSESLYIYIYIYIYIQGVSRLKGITAGDDFLGLCDQKSSYKHVSDFGRLRSYDRFLIPVHALV